MFSAPGAPTRWPVLDNVACLRAIAYIKLSRAWRRLRGIAGKPWALLGLAIGIGVIAYVQLQLLRSFNDSPAAAAELVAADGAGFVQWALRLAPLLLPYLLVRATSWSPLRLEVADVSWLLTAPGGARGIFIWELAVKPARYALVGYAGTVIARAVLGLPIGAAWKVALVGACLGLTVRLVSFGGHIVAARGGDLPVRLVAGAWALALALAVPFSYPASIWLQLRPLTERLLTAAVTPGAVPGWWLLSVLAVLLAAAVAVVAHAHGFQERAENAARQIAHAQEAMRRSRSGQELAETQFRTGTPSLRGRSFFTGERALCYRALAQERRLLRHNMIQLAIGLAITIGVLVLWPAYAWAPTVLWLLMFILSGGGAGLAVEMDHYHLRLAPLRPYPALLWLASVPVMVTSLMTLLLWVPVLASPAITPGVWLSGAVLIPSVLALTEASGSLATSITAETEGMLARFALTAGLSISGLLPGAALLAISLFAPLTAATPLAAAALLIVAGGYLALTCRRVWPGRKTYAGPQPAQVAPSG